MTPWRRLVVGVCIVASCHSGESDLVEPRPVESDGVDDRPAPPAAAPEAAVVPDALPDGFVVVPLPAWGVEITMPEEPASRMAISADSVHVELSWKRTLGIRRHATPVPTELAATGRDVEVIARGTSDAGAPWVVYTFEAYEGFRSGGKNIHRVIHVSRFVALFALDEASHLECTGYVEHDIDTFDDVEDVAKICLSMRAL